MATNEIKHNATTLPLTPTPDDAVSGDPVRVGKITGVVLVSEVEATEVAVVDFGQNVWSLTVDDNEGTGIAVGDPLYFHDTGTGTGSVHVNNSSGSADAFFGYALGTATANQTKAMNVLHTLQQP